MSSSLIGPEFAACAPAAAAPTPPCADGIPLSVTDWLPPLSAWDTQIPAPATTAVRATPTAIMRLRFDAP
ncbi:hypothetical protein ACH4TX_21650 [Streptomyces sp. NPDC021098]|uniref:hypothetical protein n=1 Tax=unclassified Streptomyces TaxID=2593676 RepID=UPI0037B992EA